jgi:creatinine amidohydrolase/Fe(II)-dependent formamide hydrolase-like protein
MPGEREAMQGDSHAGLWETSLLLKVRPELVDPCFAGLSPVRFPLIDALRENYPLRLGNRMGYIGSPAIASAEYGELARRLLVDASWEVIRPVFTAQDESWQQTSFLYKVPFLRTGFPYVAVGIVLVLIGWGALRWLR